MATVAGLAAALLVGAATTPATAGGPVDGSTGGGDPYFPAAGNGGYQVTHYDLRFDYTPATQALSASATVAAKAAAKPLRSFSLDLRDLSVTAVKVNRAPAAFTHSAGELVITPAKPLPAGKPFWVSVVYGGTTGKPLDNTGAPYGWYSFADGAFVANEPEGASTWYPVNDAPYDKATYDFRVTVPEGTVAVGNGELVSSTTSGGKTTWHWSSDDPMASYLSTAATGNYDLTTSTTPDGLPIINAVDRDLTDAQKATAASRLALQPAMIEFFEGRFGPYPFGSFGAIIDDDSVGYALETQTRPIYSRVPSESTIAHELAHMWFGDKVTPARWRDIWLNEGFAVYAEWLWSESRGGATPQQSFDDVYAIPADNAFWDLPIGDPGAENLFHGAVYDRGAATLHALRLTIGDDAFFTVLRRWAARNQNTPAATADLINLAERVSRRQLDAFFQAWLYTPEKPPAP